MNIPLYTSVHQKVLSMTYRQLYESGSKPVTFSDAGFRIHSQHDEDGILLLIFSIIGTNSKCCVEICSGNGIECNTANLILNHRWTGLMFDGNEEQVARARQFYSNHPDTRFWPPRIAREWITRENINQLVSENGFAGEIDLLSLDIDGNDYWIWKELNCISPRVVVLEFNHLWGPEKAVTIPYSADFQAEFTQHGSDYCGASLQAFIKLGRKKNYRFVGTNTIATNAFFIRNDIDCHWLPEIEAATCFSHPRAQFGMQQRLPNVINREWVEV